MAEFDESCGGNCAGCGEDCPSRQEPESLLAKPREDTHVGKVIAVVSGKGGVGKSLVTGITAVSARRLGRSVAIIDADITGPSIPKMFGVHEKAMGTADGAILPAITKTGIKMMSLNLLVENESDPVLWRGPIIAGVVKQFWTDVEWEDTDFLFIDMPPGTGDVPLTVFQSIPVDGIVVVTSPQELVSMIVEKAVKMAEMMDVPILGLVENMSYAICPDCGKKIELFGKSRLEEVAKAFNIPVIGRIPVASEFAELSDEGRIEDFDASKAEIDLGKILG